VVVEASPWVEDNQWVLDLAKDHPIIVGLVGHLEPGTGDFAAHLTRFARNPLFRGIRLSGNAIAAGLDNSAFLDGLGRLADAGLMIDSIGGANVIAALLKLSDRIPKLKIAIDHMPGEPGGWQARDDARAGLRELAVRPQVYAKVSGVLKRINDRVPDDAASYRAALDEVWAAFGDNRVMYGSNWPVSDRMAPYATVLKVVREYVSVKGTAASAKFFAGNAKRCYGWIERG
jgi:L-fuconolactonase